MNFGEALNCVKNGEKIARKNWNGKNQYVFLIQAKDLMDTVAKYIDTPVMITSVLAIKTTSNQVQVGWLATQSDMLSDDWYVVGGEEEC